jgi:hypothetical protein
MHSPVLIIMYHSTTKLASIISEVKSIYYRGREEKCCQTRVDKQGHHRECHRWGDGWDYAPSDHQRRKKRFSVGYEHSSPGQYSASLRETVLGTFGLLFKLTISCELSIAKEMKMHSNRIHPTILIDDFLPFTRMLS